MAYTVSRGLLDKRLKAIRDLHASGEFARKSPMYGTLPEGQMPLAVHYCARLWGTSPQPAALTLRLLAEVGDIVLVRPGRKGKPGIPAIYSVLPPPQAKNEEHK